MSYLLLAGIAIAAMVAIMIIAAVLLGKKADVKETERKEEDGQEY